MRLYNLNDDPDNLCHCDEKTWLAVWADTPEQAVALFLKYAAPDCDGPDNVTWEIASTTLTPARDWPHVERRNEVLRAIGYATGSEPACGTCGLAAMDDDRFRVCPDCCQCRECVCDCCDDADTPVIVGEP